MIKVPTTKTKRNLFFAILICLVFMAGFFLSIVYIDNLRSEVVSKRLELASEQLFSSSLQGAKVALETSVGNLELFDSYFIDNEDIIGFLDNIESQARQKNIDVELNFVTNAKPLKNPKTKLEKLEIKLRTKGSLQDTMDYYKSLALMEQYIELSDFTLNRGLNSQTDLDQADITEQSSGVVVEDEWQGESTITIYRTITN